MSSIVFFGAKPYDIASFDAANKNFGFEIKYYKGNLNMDNLILARGVDVVCIFVNDNADAGVVKALSENGTKLLALRCAGYNNVDLRVQVIWMSGFKDVVGHKNIIKYIQNAVTADAVSHAYILNGERGSGKKLLANLFAMSLQCENRDEDGDACGKCRSCRQAAGGNQPDIIRIMHEKPNTIGVGDIRTQVNDDIMIRPYSSKYKIYIIADADMMSVEAQNALLKTIEEPPEYAVIMLLTENAETLLPTIRSRCVMMKLRNIKDQLVKKYLMEQLEVPDYKADVCVAFAQGNMGKAIMLANSEYFNEIKEEVVHLLRNIDEMTVPDLMEAVKRCMIYKMEISDYLDMIAIWYRDVLIYKATRSVDRVVFSDQMKYIRERAKKSSYEGIENILDSLEKAKARMKANVNFELTMELLLLTIKEN